MYRLRLQLFKIKNHIMELSYFYSQPLNKFVYLFHISGMK